jgi:hypothetical protein
MAGLGEVYCVSQEWAIRQKLPDGFDLEVSGERPECGPKWCLATGCCRHLFITSSSVKRLLIVPDFVAAFLICVKFFTRQFFGV